MAKYSSASAKIEFDLVGGTLQDMSAYVTDINGVDIESLTEESTPFTQAWQAHLPVGIFKVADIVIGGFYDDLATTGPDVVFNALSSGPGATSRTLKVTYGASKSTSIETWIVKMSRKLVRNGLTRFEVTLRPTGTASEA